MKDKQLEEIKKAIVPILRRNGVVRAGIFGSYARGEQKKGSDLDILIEFRGNRSLLVLIGVKQEIEEKIKRKVDVVEYGAIHHLLKEKILKEEVPVL